MRSHGDLAATKCTPVLTMALCTCPQGPGSGGGSGGGRDKAAATGPSRADANDYSQHFVDTGWRPQNFLRDAHMVGVPHCEWCTPMRHSGSPAG